MTEWNGRDKEEIMVAEETSEKPTWIVVHKDYSSIPDSLFAVRDKYTKLKARILEEGIASEEELVYSEMPDYRDLLLAHDKEYIDDFMAARSTYRTIFAGCPLTPEIRDTHLTVVGGALKCMELALRNGIALYLGGGGIHAFRDHAEGFCFMNEAAVSLLAMKTRGLIQRGLFVSGDAHQPDGTIDILSEDRDILTLSIYQDKGYPFKRGRGDLDIEVNEETSTESYLVLVKSGLNKILDEEKIDAIMYLSVSDPLDSDETSVLRISMDGLRQRDEIVIGEARARGIPIGVIAGASGTRDFDRAVDVHMNTVRIVNEFVGKS
jgi:acetoin utilization deacetylase AcuC-like enzyme